jgi:hypothetical protein
VTRKANDAAQRGEEAVIGGGSGTEIAAVTGEVA